MQKITLHFEMKSYALGSNNYKPALPTEMSNWAFKCHV